MTGVLGVDGPDDAAPDDVEISSWAGAAAAAAQEATTTRSDLEGLVIKNLSMHEDKGLLRMATNC
jgi:hypothetical protein